MATIGAEDYEYDSDPEEAKRSLAMRRREASDDEEGEAVAGGDGKPRAGRRAPIHSDESDGQGGAAEYDEEDDEEEEELGLEDEEEMDEIEDYEEEPYEDRGVGRVEGSGDVPPKELAADGPTGDGEGLADGEEEKKENEPFAVPTAGAFYMHDDRFRDNAAGRHRRTQGGRKLWESRDDKKWGHDKFEELTVHDRNYQQGRSSKGFRGRGRNRGGDRGFGRGSRPKAYHGNNNDNSTNNNNQSQGPKGVRGKGLRKYEPVAKNSVQQPSMQNKQSGKSNEKYSNSNSARAFTQNNAEFDPAPARKNVFASSLNSASPPFYPSGSSNKEIPFNQKRDGQAGSNIRNLRSSAADNAFQRGKNTVDSIGMDKLSIKDSISPVSGKTMSNVQHSSSGSATQSRIHGRSNIPPQMTYQPVPHHNNMRGSFSGQPHAVQRGNVQGRGQAPVQVPAHQLGQRPGSGSQASSPPKTGLSINSFESGEVDSPSEANKSKTAMVTKGKGVAQGSGRGSVIYGGAQVIGTTGSMTVSHGDQNFPGAPTFLPVMQFGGQHPGGMGVPAVGMAFPGYVAQPQGLGLGNSEMTWLPVLAGAAGGYCPPYITVDGAYHARPSGQSSSGATSKENITTKTNNEWKSSQRPEIVNDEFGQRQNKPRRYSEMNFGQ